MNALPWIYAHYSYLALDRLCSFDNQLVTEYHRTDYLREGNKLLASHCKYVDDQGTLLRDLLQRFTPPVPVIHAGAEISKFGEVGHRNAQDYVSIISAALVLRKVAVDNCNDLTCYLGIAILDDKLRHEYTLEFLKLEKGKGEANEVMTLEDVHQLFLQVCDTTSQAAASSKELLEMRKRHDETFHDFGHLVKHTNTDNKTSPIISH
ncbi:hypothetical protein BGZ46_002040 [Entomortierella lignicola]|nr:hypothetical protein BGZ46_002040 [Entomortierella lignicola]